MSSRANLTSPGNKSNVQFQNVDENIKPESEIGDAAVKAGTSITDANKQKSKSNVQIQTEPEKDGEDQSNANPPQSRTDLSDAIKKKSKSNAQLDDEAQAVGRVKSLSSITSADKKKSKSNTQLQDEEQFGPVTAASSAIEANRKELESNIQLHSEQEVEDLIESEISADKKEEEEISEDYSYLTQMSFETESILSDKRKYTNLLDIYGEFYEGSEEGAVRYANPCLNLEDFPPLYTPDLDAVFDYIAPEPIYDEYGCEKYLESCRELEIVPISRVLYSLSTDTLNLKYYGLTLKQVRAICNALKENKCVENIIFQDNWFEPESARHISELLLESCSIKQLDLRECRLGEDGAEMLSEGLMMAQQLEELDLSFNSLGDKGLVVLKTSLAESSSIKKLNLGHNELTEFSSDVLQYVLAENKVIEDLDLSWNAFCTGPGNRKLFAGFVLNEQVKSLKLCWNGIGTPQSMQPIQRYVRRSKVLNFLDLSGNRIMGPSLRMIKVAVARSKSLIEVKLGNNIYTPEEAYFLGTALVAKTCVVKRLDLENMTVNKDFLQLAYRISLLDKTVTHGHVLSNYVINGPNINKLLFERCKYLAMKPTRKKAKKDFGHLVLRMPEGKSTKTDIRTLIKKNKVKKLDPDLLEELFNRFAPPAKKPTKKKKEITKTEIVNCDALKDAYMELYPDTVLPPEKPKKKKKKKGKKKKGKKK